MGRISIAGLLGLVASVAVVLAAIAGASAAWAGLVFLLMSGVLFTSLLALILRERRDPAWIGAALFGWGYYLLGLIPATSGHAALLPTAVAGWIFEKANPPPPVTRQSPTSPFVQPADPQVVEVNTAWMNYLNRHSNADQIGSWAAVLLFARAGFLIGKVLARGQGSRVQAGVPAESSPPSR